MAECKTLTVLKKLRSVGKKLKNIAPNGLQIAEGGALYH
jgi:hypothetical protein